MRGTSLFVLAAFFFAPAAWAGSPSSRLVYARAPGAESCPDEDAFRKEVASRLGYDPFFPWASRTVSVEIDLAGGTGRARVVFVDDKGFEQGAQTIDGGREAVASCEPLVRSAALAVSVSLEAIPPDPAPDAEPTPAPVEAQKPEPVVAPAPIAVAVPHAMPPREAPRRAPRSGRALVASLAPELWAGFGQWPVATVGVGAAFDLRYRALSVAFEGRWDAPATLDLGGGESAQVERATGSLVPCGHWRVLALCGVVSLGDSWASGIDLSNARTASAFYAAFGGRVGLEVPLGSRFRWSFLAQAAGIATPMHLLVGGASAFDSGPVDVTAGSSLSVSIF
ncbi:MAG TPA: hypothetical protein VGH28_18240 [Polyangiaceae bacterium]